MLGYVHIARSNIKERQKENAFWGCPGNEYKAGRTAKGHTLEYLNTFGLNICNISHLF